MRIKKINIVTLGCSKNVVDSEKLLRQFQEGGYTIIHDPDDFDAETVIINTCGFINEAREESIGTILQFVKAKERGYIKNLYVMGCLSERYMDDMKREIPEVTRYFGVNDMRDILQESGVNFRQDLMTSRSLTTPAHYAYLKVSEGCDRTCAFCAIPLIRGKCVSRPMGDIVDEAGRLASAGVKELILIAQDLSYYGLDLYKSQMLPNLLNELLRLDAFDWIRLHYLYPANFPLKLIPVFGDNPGICKYIDIPIQHISEKMLEIMKRSHNRKETENILNTLRREIPGAAIRSTLIAGHPGETREEFTELKEFVKKFRFDRLGVFGYSHEEGTFSFINYKDEIPEKVKESRVSELMEIQQGISSELNEKQVGKILKVIIDRRENDFFTGRSEFDSPEIDQEILIPVKYDLKPGNFYQVRITQSSDFDLFGVPVGLPDPL